jgi:hypothetical protein
VVQTHLRKHTELADPLAKMAELEARAAPRPPPGSTPTPNSTRNQECALHFVAHCLSCRDSFAEGEGEEEEDINGADWLQGALVCKDPGGGARGAFAPTVEDYSFFDPRQPDTRAEGGAGKLVTSSDFWREKELPAAKRRAR